MHRRYKRGFVSIIATGVLFVVVIIVFSLGTASLSGSTDSEGLGATQQAIERAAVLCYATEGFYPPGLSYLEEHYGVQIDESRYLVRYEATGSNLMPTIRVLSR